MENKYKKYVVVLAHADGWGALSANKVVRHIHANYPDTGIFLIASQASKNKTGGILTKLDDLKPVRTLKETNLLAYFEHINANYGNSLFDEPNSAHEYYTFAQLANRFCADKTIHYTSRGGPKGGEEVLEILTKLEKEQQITPEIVLSVDTMAILPEAITARYHCFSTHPGPLDEVKVAGMQGTLRSLVNEVYYDRAGNPLPSTNTFGIGERYIKGTLFLQHPQLDKGPLIETTLTFVCPGMCAYRTRDEVYHALTDVMLSLLPTLLDQDKRVALVQKAVGHKEIVDSIPCQHIPDLESEPFAAWQSQAIGFGNGYGQYGVEVVQNQIVCPLYFKGVMRRFFPNKEADFEKIFTAIFGTTIDEIAALQDARLKDPRNRLYAGKPIEIKVYDPKTGNVVGQYGNQGKVQREP